VVTAGKMHMLFKKETANKRTLLTAVSLFEQAFRSEEEKLQAAVARELHVSPGRLGVKSELQGGNKMHTTFKLDDLNVVTLAHKLEQKVMANKFNPIPSYPIHKMYIEEIFDCGHTAATPVQLLQQPLHRSSVFDGAAASMRADPPSCINPWLQEDKCVDIKLMMKCEEASAIGFVQCYRQMLCNDPQVCPSWKHFSSTGGVPNCKQTKEPLSSAKSTSTPSPSAGTDTLLALLEEERQRRHMQPRQDQAPDGDVSDIVS
jgi:hypothetical protein